MLFIREYKATIEENLLSSWLREDERGEEERMAKAEKKEEEKGEKRKREEEKEENEMETVKRRCQGCVSVDAFVIFSPRGDYGISCWAQTTRRWILVESWKKQGTKKAARFVRPSAQMSE